jgi:NADH:ubiquinone oxidoreductase subunit 4 (subunit M)
VTTALIVLPLAAALVVWLLPLPGRAAGVLALLAALAELVLWVVAVAGFDFDEGLQLRTGTAGSPTSASPTTSASSATRSGSPA